MTASKPQRASTARWKGQADPDDPRLKLIQEDNPTALVNIAPEALIPVIREVYTRMPRLLYQTEHYIRAQVTPDDTDDLFRMLFWDEFTRCTMTDPPLRMSIKNMARGGLNSMTIYNRYANNRHKMLWIITPPKNYAHAMRLLLERGMNALFQVMSMPLTDKKGRPDHKLIEKIIKIVQITDLRVKGAIPQTINMHQKNLNLNVDASQEDTRNLGMSVEQLLTLPMEQLEVLNSKSSRLAAMAAKLPGADTIDITPLDPQYALSEMPANIDRIERLEYEGGETTYESEILKD